MRLQYSINFSTVLAVFKSNFFFTFFFTSFQPIFNINTVKPANKGHPRERKIKVHGLYRQVVFIVDFFVLFYQGRLNEMWPFFTGWSLSTSGL